MCCPIPASAVHLVDLSKADVVAGCSDRAAGGAFHLCDVHAIERVLDDPLRCRDHRPKRHVPTWPTTGREESYSSRQAGLFLANPSHSRRTGMLLGIQIRDPPSDLWNWHFSA